MRLRSYIVHVLYKLQFIYEDNEYEYEHAMRSWQLYTAISVSLYEMDLLIGTTRDIKRSYSVYPKRIDLIKYRLLHCVYAPGIGDERKWIFINSKWW